MFAALELNWTVELIPGLNARMAVSSTTKQLRISPEAAFTPTELRRLAVHEVGTHIFRFENGSRQPLKLLACGLGRYTSTEEGLAGYHERLSGLTDQTVLRRYAARVLAVDAARTGSFFDVFSMLLDHVSPAEAFEITIRVKRGLPNGASHGGFLKDHVYLQGIEEVSTLIERDASSYELLTGTKVGWRLIGYVGYLREDGLFSPPVLTLDRLREALSTVSVPGSI